MHDLNHLSYNRRRVVSQYAKRPDVLFASEETALSFVPAHLRRSVLDLGVGAGRTATALSTMFSSYVGADYAPEMVAAAKRRFPSLKFVVMDARNIAFREKFDCILFSFNGIDAIPPRDRAMVFVSVRAALKDGGTFIYSTHNLSCPRAEYYRRSFFVKELFDPLWKPHRIARRLLNRASRFWRCRGDYPYVWINDPCDDFSLINLYADVPAELHLLPSYGFSPIAAVGARGVSAELTQDPWVYVVARADRVCGGPTATN